MKGWDLTKEQLDIQTCNAPHGGNATILMNNATEPICDVPILTSNVTLNVNGTSIEDHYTQKPKDYTVFLASLTAFIAFFNLLMILFFNAPFKRAMANKDEPKNT